MHPYYYAPRGAYDNLWHFAGAVFMLLFWGALIYGIIVLVSRRSHEHHHDARDVQPPAETPLDIAKRRYASGEISKEDYDRLVADLTS